MIRKTENCLYCGEKMDSITAKKKFCCDLHRVYWNREQKLNTEVVLPQYDGIETNRVSMDELGQYDTNLSEMEKMFQENLQKIKNKK